MARADVVILGAVIVVMGCASTQVEEPSPLARSSQANPRATRIGARIHTARVEAAVPARELGGRIQERARELGLSGPVAFVWGDVSPAPAESTRLELVVGGRHLSGWLVPEAHQVDMGTLASGIHDVIMVGAEAKGLYGHAPGLGGRIELDGAHVAWREPERTFALVSLMPGDVSAELDSGDLVAMLERLTPRVRYSVMPLPG